MRWRLLLASPLLLLLVLFAVSNSRQVQLGLWPTGFVTVLPLSAAILGPCLFAFLLGAAIAWAGSLSHRRRARRAEAELATLRAAPTLS